MTLEILTKQITKEQKFVSNHQKYKENTTKKIRVMSWGNLSGIISRASMQLNKFNNEGYSNSDAHRKHIINRFERISKINFSKGQRLPCDHCCGGIEIGSFYFINKRKSYTKYYHLSCAINMKILC